MMNIDYLPKDQFYSTIYQQSMMNIDYLPKDQCYSTIYQQSMNYKKKTQLVHIYLMDIVI